MLVLVFVLVLVLVLVLVFVLVLVLVLLLLLLWRFPDLMIERSTYLKEILCEDDTILWISKLGLFL